MFKLLVLFFCAGPAAAAVDFEKFDVEPKEFHAVGRLFADNRDFHPSTAFVVRGNTLVSCLHCVQEAIKDKIQLYFLSSKYYSAQKVERKIDGITVVVDHVKENRKYWVPIRMDSIKIAQRSEESARDENEFSLMTAGPAGNTSLEEEYGSLPLAPAELLREEFWGKPLQLAGFPDGIFTVHKYRYLEGLLNRTIIKHRCLRAWDENNYLGVSEAELKLYPHIFGCRATAGGSSGSPLLVRTPEGYRVIGIHFAGKSPGTEGSSVSVRELRNWASSELKIDL